ncbi:outer membrane lipoprotein chaperone LolA [Kangiella shandongensis]|uniref:outer membrane lipoprotein chaperone LolA n=1 Tax=Kangiella shandongensis TaxID=2763258 RepID=UPI001CC1506C|nr:outer membrane lipoprotein chaperone LolA [Kangiella shandongensis]
MKFLFEQATKIIILCVSVVFSSMNAYADAAHKLEEKLTNINSYKADFSQEIRDEFNSVLDSSSGYFELQRPKQFRWVVTDPYEQELVADGQNLWQFDRDIEQINVSGLEKSLETTPAAILTKEKVEIVDKYNVAEIDTDQDDVSLFQLSSRNEEALFERLMIEFKGDELVALKVSDNLGQTTLIEFNNVSLEPDFGDEYFKFVAPEDVDVIDNREKVADNVSQEAL